MKHISVLLALALSTSSAAAEDAVAEPGRILSAFFGLDDSRRLRVRTLAACRGASGGDGMPVILSHEIDERTLDPEDFRVTTRSGAVGDVACVTLKPADEPGEKRTVLVIGDYGAADDQPATVEIVGDLISLDRRVNFSGAQAEVIPLEAGPTMILAEAVPLPDWTLGGRGDCPRSGVKGVVRATWVGGVTKPGGDEIDALEMQLYRVTVRLTDGAVETVAPLAVGDLNDNDNNHELCLGVDGAPLSVSFPAGALTDPNEDLNPDTEVQVAAPE